MITIMYVTMNTTVVTAPWSRYRRGRLGPVEIPVEDALLALVEAKLGEVVVLLGDRVSEEEL